MANNYSANTTKSFNLWRTVFQYVACNWVITNIVRCKYNFIKTEGRENIDKKKKYIVASNHVTGFDPFLIAAQVRLTTAYMAKIQLFETFWSMVLMNWCGAFVVNRDKVDVSTIKTALSLKKTSWHLGIFPQGTRCNNGKLENVMKGFASIAKKLEADVLPVAVIVKDNPNSKKKDFQIKIGKPIPYTEENLVDKWGNAVAELAGLEYIPS